jgi:hypothetical protein
MSCPQPRISTLALVVAMAFPDISTLPIEERLQFNMIHAHNTFKVRVRQWRSRCMSP